MISRKGILDRLHSREKELTQQFPEVWVEDKPPPAKACKISPTDNITQTQYCQTALGSQHCLGPAGPC